MRVPTKHASAVMRNMLIAWLFRKRRALGYGTIALSRNMNDRVQAGLPSGVLAIAAIDAHTPEHHEKSSLLLRSESRTSQ
jgi:hypothetical protein